MMFKKNPNMYFYRHNEPGVVSKKAISQGMIEDLADFALCWFQEQWTGDWTDEEKELFMKVILNIRLLHIDGN